MEKIVAVAIKVFGVTNSLPAPARHADVLKKLIDFNRVPDFNPLVMLGDAEGFLTSTGRFVNRREAARIALAARQTTKLIDPPELFSEDLW